MGFVFSTPESDPRAFEGLDKIELLRRRDLWKLADRLQVPYPTGATKEKMLEILHGIPHIVAALNEVQISPDSADVGNIVEKISSPRPPGLGERTASQDDLSLRAMNTFQLRAYARKRGMELPKKSSKTDLLKALGVDPDAA
jgi:hypothetical protein